MIALDIIKEQYAKMPDEELIRFAKNESQHLTIESFRLLISEFEIRNLDIDILETVETDKELLKLSKQSYFEQKTSEEFEQSILDYALGEKEKGSSNVIIYNGLIKKGLDEEYAFMFVQSLGWKVRKLVDHYSGRLIVGCIGVFGGIILFTLFSVETLGPMFALYGIVAIIIGVVAIIINLSRKEKYQAILKFIESEESETNEDKAIFKEQLN